MVQGLIRKLIKKKINVKSEEKFFPKDFIIHDLMMKEKNICKKTNNVGSLYYIYCVMYVLPILYLLLLLLIARVTFIYGSRKKKRTCYNYNFTIYKNYIFTKDYILYMKKLLP